MFDVLVSHIQEKVDITKEETELLKTFFVHKTLLKKQIISITMV